MTVSPSPPTVSPRPAKLEPLRRDVQPLRRIEDVTDAAAAGDAPRFADGHRHRVDPGHDPATGAHLDPTSGDSTGTASSTPDRREWLKLHAADLIDKLAHWSDQLDAREAGLNVREAIQDRQRRQDRLRLQSLAAEIVEARAELDQIRRQIAAEARRTAFASCQSGHR